MTITEFSAYDLYKYYPDIDNDRYYNYRVKKKNKLVKGAKYMLKGLECDGFEMPARVYQVVAIVNSVNDVVLDSVVMRQLKGFEDDTKFTLSRQDCQVLHIKYEPGLQLFPSGLRWKKYNDRIETGKTEFIEEDMSTYPVSRIDGSIRHIIVKIDRFYIDGLNVVDSEKDKKYMIDSFLSALKVTSRGHLVSHRDAMSAGIQLYKKDEALPFRIIVDDTDALLVEIFLKKPAKGLTTEDGIIGIPPSLLSKKRITDLISITLDEFKLAKKKCVSSIQKYQEKTGEEFKINNTTFIGSGYDGFFTKSDRRHKPHVGDMMYNLNTQNLMVNTPDGIWTMINKLR